MNKKIALLIVAIASVFGVGSFIGFRTFIPHQVSAQIQPIVNATSAEEASDIVDFVIASPTIIPEGFEANSKYIIDTVGQSSWAFKTVTRIWTPKEDPSVLLILTQSPKKFEISGGQPIEINEVTGQRAVSQCLGNETQKLTLAWTQNSMFFVLTGTIKDSLDEQTMLNVAKSVKFP